MADGTTIKNATGATITAATDELSDGQFAPKVQLLDGSTSPVPISPATQTTSAAILTAVTGTGASAQHVQGPVADYAAAAGNAVPIGGVFKTHTTLTSGQRAEAVVDNQGRFVAMLGVAGGGASTVITARNDQSDAVAAASNIVNLSVINRPTLYNPATLAWDRQRNNSELTILASAARTATPTKVDQTNHNWRSGLFIINVSAIAATPSVVPTIQGKCPISGTYYTILTGAAITGTGITVLKVGPGITVAANVAVADILPRTFAIDMVHGDADSITYSVAFVGVV